MKRKVILSVDELERKYGITKEESIFWHDFSVAFKKLLTERFNEWRASLPS